MRRRTLALLLNTIPAAVAAAPTASVVFSFERQTGDGPFTGLLEYGTSYVTGLPSGGPPNCGARGGCGTILRLGPSNDTHPVWTSKVLASFSGPPSPAIPLDSPIADKHGNLFFSTLTGGVTGQGTVVELTRAALRAPWKATVLHAFSSQQDGANPLRRPYLDASGNLFLTTNNGGPNNGGTFVELSPPATGQNSWTATLLYGFGAVNDGAQPSSGLRADAQGNFYLTTSGGGLGYGTAVELSPPTQGQTSWSEHVIHAFGSQANDGVFPGSGLIADAHGNLFGTTTGGGAADDGTIYELSPQGGGGTAWNETVLYEFTGGADGAGPSGFLMDAGGNIFVTTIGGNDGSVNGTLVKLAPPQNGGTAWTETTLYRFPGGNGGSVPGAITADENGNFLIPTQNGGIHNKGALIQITGVGYVKK